MSIDGKGADLWHPIRTASEHPSEEDLAAQNRGTAYALASWAARTRSPCPHCQGTGRALPGARWVTTEELCELVEMLGLDVEAARQ